ncbi:MAG: hypothetical protein IPJ89_03250 [Candidatus Iainarchaeum archaeon]|uniref:Class I SAM-dependent methyltransferase n=1 Tax=Candidatus Iainarchaeum sp. TaxID=3101447 RepID=A0A7T9I1Y8_9ARCH|nr:MAG: hypothetical protein IPJ89_03250 [Candidatus Diapherotrites archaeon]
MPVVKRKRMFRGAARGRVFQTVDLGAGKGEYIERQSRRFPNRKYAAVDFLLGPEKFFDAVGQRLHKNGVGVGDDVTTFLRQMIERKEKTRHLNMDMPYPFDTSAYASESQRAFKSALEMIPRVLLPNGKFYITSESSWTIRLMQKLAEKQGFAARQLRTIPPLSSSDLLTTAQQRALRMKQPDYYHPGMVWAFANQPIYRLEITYNLKKALPSKDARRKLAQPRASFEKKKPK